MLTEDEARTKRCCGSEMCGKAVIEGERHCVASECMAWRWDMAWWNSIEEDHGGDLVLRLKRRQGEPKRGYCGLAESAQS